MSLVIDWKRYSLNVAITIPSIFLLFYLSGHILSYLSGIDIALVMLPVFVRHTVPGRLGAHIYPASLIIFLLLLLGTIYQISIGHNLPVISALKIPLTFTTYTSALFALAIDLLIEAFINSKLTATIGYYVGSLLIFLWQLSVVTVMLSPDLGSITSQAGSALFSLFHINNPSAYESAYAATLSLEGYALYSLFVYGYQQYLPLATVPTPVDPVMIALFIVSTTGILIALYTRFNNRSSSRLGMLGTYVVVGAIIAAVVLAVASRIEYTSYQILAILGSTSAMLIITGYTSSKVPGSETINTSIK